MGFRVEKDVMVRMRDGVELATDTWVPDQAPAPTLLVRLPYGKDLTALLAYGLMPNLFALIEAGYAVVYQDCRGTFRSGGEFVPMVNEPNDGADTIAWLVEQPWCDGNIGTFGASYLGFVQWASASVSPHLKAIAPAVTTTDYYTTPWYSEGGALSWHTVQSWSTGMALAETQRAVTAGTVTRSCWATWLLWWATCSRTWRPCPCATSCWRRCGPGGATCSGTQAATSTGRTCR